MQQYIWQQENEFKVVGISAIQIQALKFLNIWNYKMNQFVSLILSLPLQLRGKISRPDDSCAFFTGVGHFLLVFKSITSLLHLSSYWTQSDCDLMQSCSLKKSKREAEGNWNLVTWSLWDWGLILSFSGVNGSCLNLSLFSEWHGAVDFENIF